MSTLFELAVLFFREMANALKMVWSSFAKRRMQFLVENLVNFKFCQSEFTDSSLTGFI